MKVEFVNGKEVLVNENNFSFLKAVQRVDSLPENYENLPKFQENVHLLTTHDGERTIGYLLDPVLKELKQCPSFDQVFRCDERRIYVIPDTFEARNDAIATIANEFREISKLHVIKGWRGELYTVKTQGTAYFLVERAFSICLGVVTYGVHLNGYYFEEGKLKMWIPRRSATKSTWPSMLDNIVAGGIGYPYGIHETVIKESMEEAHLSGDQLKTLKPVGCVSYFHFEGGSSSNFDTENDMIGGEVEYLYDLELNKDIVPKPNDDEVESFNLMTLQEIIDRIDEFKPNCGIVIVDFLIRHGYITAENEPHYYEISAMCHRKLL